MSFTKKIDSRMLGLFLIALIGGVIGGYVSNVSVKGTKFESLSNYFNAQLVTKDTEITTLSKTVSDLGTQVSQLEGNIDDIGSLEAPDNAEVLAALDQLRDEQPILHYLYWDTQLSQDGSYSIRITSSEPFEVKSVAVYFHDQDRATQFTFHRMVGQGNYNIETYRPSPIQAFYSNLFSDMNVNIPPSVLANGSFSIYFDVETGSPGFDGDELFLVEVMIETLRQATTSLNVVQHQ